MGDVLGRSSRWTEVGKGKGARNSGEYVKGGARNSGVWEQVGLYAKKQGTKGDILEQTAMLKLTTPPSTQHSIILPLLQQRSV